MDSKNMLMNVLGIVFFILAAYAVYNYVYPSLVNAEGEQKVSDLYLKSLEVGKNAANYEYSYLENLDGYVLKTTLKKNGNLQVIEIETPLVKRSAYYLENDTVLCVTFEKEDKCSSVKDNNLTKEYMKKLQSIFFSPEKTKKELENNEFLINKSAISFSKVEDKKIGEKDCKNIAYTIYYSNLTLQESSKLGLSQSSPMKIDGEICYNEKDNEIYSKKFKYIYLGKERVSEFTLISANWKYNEEITVDKNLTNGSVELLLDANDKQNEFIGCLVMDDKKRDSCIFSLAFENKYPQLCQYAGSKADICTLNFAISSKDPSKCKEINDTVTTDDCYLEIAAATKNLSICDFITDKTRKPKCEELVTKNETIVIDQKNETTANNTPSNNKTNTTTSEPPDYIKNLLD